MAQMFVGSPFRIPNLAHQFWLYPGDPVPSAYLFVKRFFLGFKRVHFSVKVLYSLLIKTGAAITYVLYFFTRLDAEDERSKMLPRTCRCGISANNGLLRVLQLEF